MLQYLYCNEETFCSFVDFQKAFDYVDHGFLFHKLLNIGIYGKMYDTIKAVYEKPQSCVIVDDRLSDWFTPKAGVRQGDSLFPILFAIFINDLADQLKREKVGVMVGEHLLSILMYADDIILLAGDHSEAQRGLDILPGA